MFGGFLTRLRNAVADAVSAGIEMGVRRALENLFGPLAAGLEGEPESLPEPEVNGTAHEEKPRVKARR